MRLPLNKIINVNKIVKVKQQLAQDLMRDPTREELEEELDDPTILDDLKHLHYMISLDKPRTDNNEDLHSVISKTEKDLDKLLEDFRVELKDLIKHFPDREQTILLMYYGIDHPRPYTLNEIGEELGLTRERIRQIKEHVLKKLREKRDTEKLKEYDGIH